MNEEWVLKYPLFLRVYKSYLLVRKLLVNIYSSPKMRRPYFEMFQSQRNNFMNFQQTDILPNTSSLPSHRSQKASLHERFLLSTRFQPPLWLKFVYGIICAVYVLVEMDDPSIAPNNRSWKYCSQSMTPLSGTMRYKRSPTAGCIRRASFTTAPK